MLTDLRSILALAEEKGCAIPAFNCYTQECVMGVLEAAKETGAPVIFQMFSRLADTNDGNFVAPAILEAIRQLPQPRYDTPLSFSSASAMHRHFYSFP